MPRPALERRAGYDGTARFPAAENNGRRPVFEHILRGGHVHLDVPFGRKSVKAAGHAHQPAHLLTHECAALFRRDIIRNVVQRPNGDDGHAVIVLRGEHLREHLACIALLAAVPEFVIVLLVERPVILIAVCQKALAARRAQRNLAPVIAIDDRNGRQSVRIARTVRHAQQLRPSLRAQRVEHLQCARVVAVRPDVRIQKHFDHDDLPPRSYLL